MWGGPQEAVPGEQANMVAPGTSVAVLAMQNHRSEGPLAGKVDSLWQLFDHRVWKREVTRRLPECD